MVAYESAGSERLECNNMHGLTGNKVHIISPRTSLAVPTSIGPSVLLVGHVSSRACSTPSLVLYSEGSVTSPRGCQCTFFDGVYSFSVVASHQDVTAVHLWNGSTTSISEAAYVPDCSEIKKTIIVICICVKLFSVLKGAPSGAGKGEGGSCCFFFGSINYVKIQEEGNINCEFSGVFTETHDRQNTHPPVCFVLEAQDIIIILYCFLG